MAERIIPGVVKMYNSGRIGNDYKVFESKDYYEHVLTQIFPKSDIESFINGIFIIPRRYIQRPNWHCVLIILPDDGQIGDAVGVGIIVDTKAQKAVSYSLEKSFKGYMICQWEGKKHFNFGSIPDKVSFFASIVPLASEEFDSLSTSDTETNKENNDSYHQRTDTKQNPVGEKKKYHKNGNPNKFLIVIFVLLTIILIVYFTKSDSVGKESDTELKTENVKNFNDVIDDKRVNPESKEEIDGEVYTYYPEDGTIRNQFGEIVSGELPTKNTESQKKKYTREENTYDTSYDDVEIEHYLNGEFPYASVYGRGKFDKESLSYLRLLNESSTDAVVLLCNADGEIIRNVFVKQGSEYTMKQIPACICIVKIMFGNDWYKGKDNGVNFPPGGFTKNVSYSISKWSDAFNFIPHYVDEGIDYPTYELTLHTVANGNFKTKASNKNEFFNN